MSGGVLTAYQFDQDESWSSGTKPVTDDAAIVSETLGGTVTITDATGHAATIDLDLLQVHPLAAASFGTSGSPIVGCADLIQLYGLGGFYFECTANGTSWKTDRVEIAAANANVPIELGSETGDAGDYDEILAMRGRILLRGGCQFGASGIVSVSRVKSNEDVNLEIASTADTLPTLDVSSGIVKAANTITNLRQSGGQVTKTTAKITTADVYGGTLFYEHTAISGDGTTIRVHPGAMLHIWTDAYPKTITNLVAHPGSIIVASEHTKLHVFTNKTDLGATWIRSEAEARRIAARRAA